MITKINKITEEVDVLVLVLNELVESFKVTEHRIETKKEEILGNAKVQKLNRSE